MRTNTDISNDSHDKDEKNDDCDDHRQGNKLEQGS